MNIRTNKHYSQLRNLIGQIGMREVLEALSEIAQGHSDTQAKNDLPVGASSFLAAALSDIAAKYEHERSFEIHKNSDGDS